MEKMPNSILNQLLFIHNFPKYPYLKSLVLRKAFGITLVDCLAVRR
jgi:hypothetical protein